MLRIEKPWGYEELLEHNDNYVLKRLCVYGERCCSLQYHEEKHETIYVLDGEMRLVIGDSEDTLEDIILKAGDYYVVPPGKVHRMCGVTNCIYIEASTSQLDDVIRLQDDYGRN